MENAAAKKRAIGTTAACTRAIAAKKTAACILSII